MLILVRILDLKGLTGEDRSALVPNTGKPDLDLRRFELLESNLGLPMVNLVLAFTETVTSSFFIALIDLALVFLALIGLTGEESERGHSPRQAAKTSLGAIKGSAKANRFKVWSSVGLEDLEKAPES